MFQAFRDVLYRSEICVISTCSHSQMLGNAESKTIIRYFVQLYEESPRGGSQVSTASFLTFTWLNAIETVPMA